MVGGDGTRPSSHRPTLDGRVDGEGETPQVEQPACTAVTDSSSKRPRQHQWELFPPERIPVRLARLRVSISARPAVADVRRQWGMEDLVGLEIELGDAVEYPLAGPE